MRDLVSGPRQQLCLSVADHRAERRVDAQEPPGQVGDRHAGRRGVDGQAPALFGLLQDTAIHGVPDSREAARSGVRRHATFSGEWE
jgi:hypothetical protein